MNPNKNFAKELRKLNMELQQENSIRINKIKEYKRNQIIEADLAIKEKLKQKKIEQLLHDSNKRKQAVAENTTKKAQTDLLLQEVKKNSFQENKKDLLVSKLRQINLKYHLGVSLDLPLHKKKREN